MARRELCLHGHVAPEAVPEIRAAFRSAAAPRRVDLSAVTSMSSPALAELVMAAHRIGPDRITLANPQPLMERTLRILGMDRFFELSSERR